MDLEKRGVLNVFHGLMNILKQKRIQAGYVIVIIFILFSRIDTVFVLIGGIFVLAGILWRAWAAGYISKNKSIPFGGPYLLCRHPLYFGSFLMGIGTGIMCGNLVFPFLVIIFFVFAYFPLMKDEENKLIDIFNEEYRSYAAAVPMFIPFYRSSLKPNSEFDWNLVIKNKEYRAWFGILTFIIFFVIKNSMA